MNKNRYKLILASFFLILFTGSGCQNPTTAQLNRSSSLEHYLFVEVASFSDSGSAIKPRIFLHEPAGDKICRRGKPDESIYGLDPEEEIQGAETTGGDEEDEDEEDSTSTVNIPATVGANWFQMGLVIGNRHNSYYAVIENLIFSMSANWGDEILTGSKQIDSGYCETSPLYIVAPISRNAGSDKIRGDPYYRLKKNYINNLTLYVDGVPIPTGPPKKANIDSNSSSDTLDNIRATANDAAGVEGSGDSSQAEEEFVLTYLPTYRVKLLIIGYWIDKTRAEKANLRKTITFTLSSDFLN